MNQQNTGTFIAKKRKEKNLTQEQLAEILQVSNKTISKWETGKCMPDYSIIESLCNELNITVPELLEGKELNPSETIDEKKYNMEEKYNMLLYKVQQTENQIQTIQHNTQTKIKAGISFGCALAMVISYVNWQSIGWAIVHGFMSWGYIIYYLIRY